MSDSTAGGPPDEGYRGHDDLFAALAADGEETSDLTADDEGADAALAGPHRRVIGTPAPAEARTMLGLAEPQAPAGPPRELPGDPPDLDQAKRAERVVAACFIIAMLGGIGFIVAYLAIQVHSVSAVTHSNLALGTALSIALLGLGIGATIWVRHLMPDVELTEERKPLASAAADRALFATTFNEGTEASQYVKRPLVRRTLIAATLPLGFISILLFKDLGPLPRKSLEFTVWRKGIRLIEYASNRPLKPSDFSSPGGMITVVPEGYQDNFDALAKAAVIIIKFRPEDLQPPTVMNWTVDGIVAYSKICTHVGCPAALYEQTTQHILCPCHQSTFDAPRGAKVIFGPATRPLPQLPITTNAQGYLVAQSDFHEPVGPSYWERS
jgi:ubiquinol-cytochrome c reductase iron-sulfur subunit